MSTPCLQFARFGIRGTLIRDCDLQLSLPTAFTSRKMTTRMLPSSTANEARHLKLVYAALFAGFVISGMTATILGPSLPTFIARWTLDDTQAGLFFTAQFTGSLLGVLLSSAILSMRGYRDALVLGFFLTAVGVTGLNSASRYLALAATALYGFGFGLAIPATNLCVAEISGTRRAAALNLLNMAWGVGAIACPVLLLAGLRADRYTAVLLSIAASALLLGIFFAGMKFESLSLKSPDGAGVDRKITSAHPIHVPVALALLFYLYIGTENGTSGWAAEQAHRVGTGNASTVMPMFFWAGLLSGRGISALILTRVRESWLVITGLLLSALGTMLLLLATTRSQVILGVVLAGFGLASIYPIFISWLSKWYGERARRLGGVMFSLAALGGATMPWMVGFISQRANSLRVGLLVPLAGCTAMIALVAVLRRRIAG
jgi:FHS family glucose/mannose:H+ symporter-like MFS transporter